MVIVVEKREVEYNPDERGERMPIEDEKFTRTADELSCELEEGGTIHLYRDGNVRGVWWDRKVVDRDTHAVIEIDMEDTEHARGFVIRYVREILLDRFRQKAIYVKFVVPVDRLIVTEEEVTA
jgi:hypothetical protein